jgi:N-acetylneuraminic acid mutarotase
MAYLPDSIARSNAMSFATTTKGYLIGGLKQDGITKLGDTWEYDPIANAWTQKTSFIGTARMDAIAFCINNIGYIAGGYDGNNYLKDFYSFDPTQNGGQGAWTSLGSMPGSKRRGGSAFVYQNKAYIVAGLDNTIYPSDFWSYDPSQPFASAWTQKNAIANVSPNTFDDGYTGITRANAAAFVMGVKGYLATGDAGSLYKSVWEYDFASDLWTQKSDFEVGALTGAVAFTVNSRGFVLTGNASSNYYSEFSEFHPFEAYNQYD